MNLLVEATNGSLDVNPNGKWFLLRTVIDFLRSFTLESTLDDETSEKVKLDVEALMRWLEV